MRKNESKSGNYVFKETPGSIRFIGDFDGLYKNIEDPWGQLNDEHYRRRSQLIIDTLRELKPRNVLDIGCGFGCITQLIQYMVTSKTIGVDISSEAIKKATKMFPTVEFHTFDILKEDIQDKVDAIVLSGLLWYLLDDLDGVMSKLEEGLNYQGHLIIFQTFLEDQRFGRNIINGYNGFLQYLCNVKGFRIVKSVYCDKRDTKKDSITVLQRWGGNYE